MAITHVFDPRTGPTPAPDQRYLWTRALDASETEQLEHLRLTTINNDKGGKKISDLCLEYAFPLTAEAIARATAFDLYEALSLMGRATPFASPIALSTRELMITRLSDRLFQAAIHSFALPYVINTEIGERYLSTIRGLFVREEGRAGRATSLADLETLANLTLHLKSTFPGGVARDVPVCVTFAPDLAGLLVQFTAAPAMNVALRIFAAAELPEPDTLWTPKDEQRFFRGVSLGSPNFEASTNRRRKLRRENMTMCKSFVMDPETGNLGVRDIDILVRTLLHLGARPQTFLRAAGALHNCMYPTVAQTLLNGGADPTALDEQGRTPLMAAEQGGRPAVAELLRARAASPLSGWQMCALWISRILCCRCLICCCCCSKPTVTAAYTVAPLSPTQVAVTLT